MSIAYTGRPSEEQKSIAKEGHEGEEFKQLIDLFIE